MRRGAVVLLIGLAGLTGGIWVALGTSPAVPAPGTISCVDVAPGTGLDFVGRYGPTTAPDDGGIVMQRNMGNGAAVGDVDGDGDLDVYLLANAGMPNRLFRNETGERGARRYVDITESAGVGDLGLSRAAFLADFDGDARLDLVVLNDRDPEGRLPPSRLFRGRGNGTFEDVTAASGLDPTGYLVGGGAPVDYDLDGDLDLYVAYWTMELGGTVPGREIRGSLPGENRLFRNEGGLRFSDVTAAVGLDGIRRDTFTPQFHDFDADGDLDLYLAVDHRADLYFEQRDGKFRDASEVAGVDHVGNDMGVAMADVDGSGTLDLFVTNILDPEENFGKKPRGNTLLLTESAVDGARFRDAVLDYGVRDTGWGWGAAFLDVDLDADLDLAAVQGFDEFVSIFSESLYDATSALFVARPDGSFARRPEAGCEVPGDQRALVVFDHDRDGDPDLLVTQTGLPAMLLENRSATGHFVTLRLDGAWGRGSGAVVEATVGGVTSRRLVQHGGSYLAGHALEAYVGLGSATRAERIRIRDVRGHEVVLHDVSGDQVVIVELPGP